MNINEMHIAINVGLQKMAANRTRKFLPQEIDLGINNSIDRLVKDGIRQNGEGLYEINEFYAQALAPLKEVGIPVRMEKVNPDRFMGYMPADFRFLISAAASVGKACDNTSLPAHQETWTNFIVPLGTTKTTGPFWQTFSLSLSTGETITNQSIPGYTGYLSKEEQFEFSNIIQEILWEYGINAYLETFAGLYRPNSIIIPAPNALIVNFTIDGTLVVINTAMTTSKTFYEASKVVMSHARVSKGVIAHSARTTPYFESGTDSVLLEEFGLGGLYVYADDSFIVRELQTTYLRKPRKVDVKLQRGCDLHPSFHQDICDRTITHLSERIGDPSWQQKLVEKNAQQPL